MCKYHLLCKANDLIQESCDLHARIWILINTNSADIMSTATEPIDEHTASDAAAVEEDEKPPGWLKDDRISYSKETEKYLLENDDGSEMEWFPKLKAWMPVVPSSHAPLYFNFFGAIQ